jgi:methyltransferase-like protein
MFCSWFGRSRAGLHHFIMSPETPVTNSYDELPYPPYSFPATHIGRLAAIGRLFGLETRDPSQARVLELGCGTGINCLAMAQLYPEAEFVGVDASGRQIEQGQEALLASGLANVRLRHEDIAELGADLGTFDYIIVHGIYSWVSKDVKESILRLCQHNLAEAGVAYISYNCLPGWRMRGALRDMMNMHTGGIPDLPGKVAQAKALIKFLAESCNEESPYGKYLRQELDLLRKADDSYIAHEFLEKENDAMYFTDFLQEAARHQLAYLADADPATMIVENLPQAAETLKALKLNLLATEQYMDFVRNRTFRSTLLCHAKAPVKRDIDPAQLAGMEAIAFISPKSPAAKDAASTTFIGPNGVELTVNNPISATLFTALAAGGRQGRPVAELLEAAAAAHADLLHDKDPEAVRADLGRLLLQGYLKKMLDLFVGPVGTAVSSATEGHPQSLPLARWQAGHGHRVSSRRLEMHAPDPFVSKLITVCDGTRDRSAVVDALVEAMTNQEFQLNENNQPVTDPERARFIIDNLYEGSVRNLSQLGILAATEPGHGNGQVD